ncbi:hypothetical protein [Candidatus Mycoplasma haematohominis]|uniref:hypothetical protein n=1 Tax=Candidatus Mycoplasma haematohominis TaxID=1494318 RepID=UPI001C0A6C93|nr:hypothetical protein [Candidatus Mycoplasma haemohominis]
MAIVPLIKSVIILGIGAVLIGGTGVGANFLFGAQEPFRSTLETVDDGKYASDYKRYFVDNTKNENDKWWDWVFEMRYEFDKNDEESKRHSALTKFIGLTSGSAKDKSLKKVCGDSYKESTDNVVSKTNNSIDSQKYSEDDVWRYCSIFGSKPKTLKEVSSETTRAENTFAKTKESDLIDTNYEGNEKFWNEQNKYFFSLQESELENSSMFKNLYKKEFKGQNDTIRDVCAEAYKKQSNGNTDSNAEVKETELLKFCSLKGK